MRLSIELAIQSRGPSRLRNPAIWPVFFSVDDSLLRSLMGDLSAPEYTFILGPENGSVASWRGEVSTGATGEENALLGAALLYTEGGTSNRETRKAYLELARWTKGALLTHGAQAFGLSPMLAAFGGTESSDQGDDVFSLEWLLEGFDPLEQPGRVDRTLLEGLAAFETIEDALRPVKGGVGMSRPSFADVGPEPAEETRPGRVVGPRLGRSPPLPGLRPRFRERDLRPPILDRRTVPPIESVAAGTIVAANFQAWQVAGMGPNGPLEVRRPLRSRSVPRASLMLHVTIRREG